MISVVALMLSIDDMTAKVLARSSACVAQLEARPSALTRREVLRAAVFAWTTPLVAALAKACSAAATLVLAEASPLRMAARARFKVLLSAVVMR